MCVRYTLHKTDAALNAIASALGVPLEAPDWVVPNFNVTLTSVMPVVAKEDIFRLVRVDVRHSAAMQFTYRHCGVDDVIFTRATCVGKPGDPQKGLASFCDGLFQCSLVQRNEARFDFVTS